MKQSDVSRALYMNNENDFQFKDKEIAKVTSDITKQNKREFGAEFKSATTAQSNAPSTISSSSLIQTGSTLQPKPPITDSTQTTNVTADTSSVSSAIPTKTYDPILRTLQTYEGDIAETVRTKKESIASINLAKQKKDQEEGVVRPPQKTESESRNFTRGGLTVLVSVVLIIAGIFFVGFIYFSYSNRPEAVTPATPAPISTDTKTVLEIQGLDPTNARGRIRSAFQVGATNTNNSLTRIEIPNISAATFFETIAPDAPATLARALGSQWILGFQNFQNQTSVAPFIFLTIDSFDSTFDGMLRWENNMRADLSQIFNIGNMTLVAEPNRPFEDRIIKNKDVRVLKDGAGNTILLYGFLDQKNLVITTNEQTFQEILNRFFASHIVR